MWKIEKNQNFHDFGVKNADLWLFGPVFRGLPVVGDTFFKFCWHISEGFGVEKNDAVVRFSLSSAVPKFENFLQVKKNNALPFRNN